MGVLSVKKLKELPQELSENLELPAELLPGTGKLTVSGNRRALIEGHRGILAYSPEQISVSLGRETLTVFGTALQLSAMNGDELLITGRIQRAEWG